MPRIAVRSDDPLNGRGLGVDRRGLMRGAAAAAAAGLMPAARAAGASRQVDTLRVDNRVEPLAVERRSPRLSWQTHGFSQNGYRVYVASRRDLLFNGAADLWDSGDVSGAESFDVAYRGRPLASAESAFWRVESWDGSGRRTRSTIASWRAGLLRPADWQGVWLAAEHADIAGDRAAGLHWIWAADPVSTAPLLFRRTFSLAEDCERGVLQVVARDAIDGVWLNGRPLARPEMRPGTVNTTRMETIELPISSGENILVVAASYHPERGPPSPSGGMGAVIRLHRRDDAINRLTTEHDWTVAIAARAGQPEPKSAWRVAVAARSRPRHDPWAAGPAMLLRRRFTARDGVVRATLYATALGAYYPYLNGGRVGDALLAPEWTDFSKRVLYQAYDVTGAIRSGDNMLGAIVGDGWYGSTGLFVGRYDFGPAPCRFRAQLMIDYADGTRQVVATDDGWETAPSAVLSSEIYDGEVYDARTVAAGWDTTAAAREGWRPASEAPAPAIAVTPQPDPPIRITRTLKPVSIRSPRPGVHVVDFGQNFAGWCLLSAQAAAGTRVTLRYAEILAPSGEIDQSNLRSALARDVYVFAGTGRERYRPHFTYHGFRYVQVEGWNGPLPANMLVGEAIHTDLPETGLFDIDAPLTQKLWLNTLWSQRSNFVGLPTDCPQRDERLGWMGDAGVFWDAACFNMDVSTFTRRFMADVRDAQEEGGAFADFAPQSSAAGMKGSPGWADAGIILPWTAWRRYGDTAIIDENWRAMTAWADHVLRANPGFVWREARGVDYGDWLALDAKQPGDPTTPKDLVATAMWAHATRSLAEMAAATGRETAARDLREQLMRITRAFRAAFVRADGTVGNGSQTGYLLALRYGLVPEALRPAAGAALTADIRRRGTLLSTGFLGTPIALDVLLDLGERDLVRALLDRTQFPSWGYMVARGATTIWERWNGDTGDVAMNSFNHYALGAISGFFYRRLAGIDAAAPGFAEVQIAPDLWIGAGRVATIYASQVGRIATAWRRRGAGAELTVDIPDGAIGRLRLPAGPSAAATIDRRPVDRSGAEYHADLAPGRHVVRVHG